MSSPAYKPCQHIPTFHPFTKHLLQLVEEAASLHHLLSCYPSSSITCTFCLPLTPLPPFLHSFLLALTYLKFELILFCFVLFYFSRRGVFQHFQASTFSFLFSVFRKQTAYLMLFYCQASFQCGLRI